MLITFVSMRKIHPNQKKLLEILREHIDNPLTMIDLMEELGVASTSVVHHHIVQLEKKGFLKRNPSNPRDYQILEDPEKPVVYINQYGLAQCGPKGTFLDGNPLDRVPIASKLLKFHSEEAFIVVAKGNSMQPSINQGDYIIAQKKSNSTNGETIICINNGEALIKIFYKKNDNIILHSLNPEFPPFVANEDFRIVGVVKNIIKYS